MSSSKARPVIFDFGDVHDYVAHMLRWRRATTPEFSVRKITKNLMGCSPTLVTQVAKGQRELTRERIDDFAAVLGLSQQEKLYLEQWVVRRKRENLRRKSGSAGADYQWQNLNRPTFKKRETSNHLLNDWINIYVKDACRLREFEANPKVIYRLLGGIVPLKRIKKSLDFLFKEGFLRRTLDGRIVESTVVTATTDGIPDQKLKIFHKRALEIAIRGIDLFPISERRASAVVLPVDSKNLPKIKELIFDFHERLTSFAEAHQEDSERLFQVLVNLTPIGGKTDIETISEREEKE